MARVTAHVRPDNLTTQDRLFDQIMNDGIAYSDLIHGFVGRRLRANRLVQKTDGLGSPITGIDHTLVFQLSGGRVERYSGQKRTGVNEKLRVSTLIPAFETTSWYLPGEIDVMHLYIDDVDLRRFAEMEYGFDPNCLEMRPMMGVDDKFMQHLAPLVLEELKSDLPQTHLMLDGFDSVIAGHLLRAYSNMSDVVLGREEKEKHQRDMKVARRARDILLDRLSENISAAEIATELEISPYRLMRMFKREVGTTMHQFVLQERVALVRHRLANSNDPLIDIAFDAGFASQQHMTAAFKSAMGVPPGEYRRKTCN